MDDYTRENVVGWGQAAAAYAILRNNDSMATGAILNAEAQAAIEYEHTRFIVTSNTGDARLGRRAALGSARRAAGLWLLLWAAPVAVFLLPIAVTMPAGLTPPPWFMPVWLILVFATRIAVVRMLNHHHQRGAYVRANLPSVPELQRSGYYEVEDDTWFNPITERVLYGHAYVPQEAAQGRRAYRDESRAIRALYRQQRGSGTTTTLRQAQALPPVDLFARWRR